MLRRWLTPVALAAAVALVGVVPAQAAQPSRAERLKIREQRLASMKAVWDRLPARKRALLDGISHIMARAQNRPDFAGQREGSAAVRTRRLGDGRVGSGPTPDDLVNPPFAAATPLSGGQVSDPKYDKYTLDKFWSRGGQTQSETSTAWCSPNVVIGFNDSGSYGETYLALLQGVSFNGYSNSNNNGTTFYDQGYLPTLDGTGNLFLSGDPVMGCTDANTFYYASLLEDYGSLGCASGSGECSQISVSKSTDAGVTFGAPIVAASEQLATNLTIGHFLDKEWMAVDPGHPNNIYVTYTDFDSSADTCATTFSFATNTAVAIVAASSTDGGANWNKKYIDLGCALTFYGNDDSFGNSGSQVAVAKNGDVYVAWSHFPAFGAETINFKKSTDFGTSFDLLPTIVTTVVEPGGFDASEGREEFAGKMRMNAFPQMAVDRTTGLAGKSGNIYIAWNDGRYISRPDYFSATGFYNYSDIMLTKSTDGGATWALTAPRVNTNTEPLPAPTDQFFPGIAVDKTGTIGLCFYDRRKDQFDFLQDRECAKSANAGVTWSNLKKTAASTPGSLRTQDGLINPSYQGDYDSLASDTLLLQTGFRGGYADHTLANQDVKLNKP